MKNAAVAAAVAAALVWVRFDNGRVMLVKNDDGAFDTVVSLTAPNEDSESFLDQIAEAVTGSEAGIEAFSWRRLDGGLYRVTGYISDWPNQDGEYEAASYEIVDPVKEGFVEAVAETLGVSVGEAKHAIAALHNDYGPETVISTTGGREIRFAKSPLECDCVRITVPSIVPLEIAYWTYDEWGDSPSEVMGAILETASGPTTD